MAEMSDAFKNAAGEQILGANGFRIGKWKDGRDYDPLYLVDPSTCKTCALGHRCPTGPSTPPDYWLKFTCPGFRDQTFMAMCNACTTKARAGELDLKAANGHTLVVDRVGDFSIGWREFQLGAVSDAERLNGLPEGHDPRPGLDDALQRLRGFQAEVDRIKVEKRLPASKPLPPGAIT